MVSVAFLMIQGNGVFKEVSRKTVVVIMLLDIIFTSINNLYSIEPLPHAPPFRPETFDRILLDAPCSALGQRPLTKCSLTSKELKSFHVYQRKFISQVMCIMC